MSAHRILPAGAVLPPMPGAVAVARSEDGPVGSGAPGDATTKRGDAVTGDPAGPTAPLAKTQLRSRHVPAGRDRGRRGRFHVLNDFVDGSMRHLSVGAAKAWFVLYRDTKPDGLAATGLTDIARRAGYSHKTAQRAVNELIKRGFVRRIGCGGKGKGPNVYRVVGAADSAPTAE